MRRLLLMIALIGFAQPGLSQVTVCDGECLDPVALIATVEGSFEGAALVSPDAAPDRFAALEQQRWRELRYDVLRDVILSVDFNQTSKTLPANWPESIPASEDHAKLSIHISTDGETFQRIDNGARIAKDSFVSILVSQTTAEADSGEISFFPANWQVNISTQSAGAADSDTIPPLRESEGERPLGCSQIGCGEFGTALDRPTVSGTTDFTTSTKLPSAPEQPPALNKADPTARELQTELARVGCYDGAVDGLWGPASRKAMTDFNRLNSSDVPVQTATPKALVIVARVGDVVCAAN